MKLGDIRRQMPNDFEIVVRWIDGSDKEIISHYVQGRKIILSVPRTDEFAARKILGNTRIMNFVKWAIKKDPEIEPRLAPLLDIWLKRKPKLYLSHHSKEKK